MQLSLSVFLDLSHKILHLNDFDRWTLIKQVEHDFDSEADTLLGEFLEEYVWLLLERGGLDELHQDLQDLIDAAELNDEMLVCVGNHICGYVN